MLLQHLITILIIVTLPQRVAMYSCGYNCEHEKFYLSLPLLAICGGYASEYTFYRGKSYCGNTSLIKRSNFFDILIG